MTWLDRALQRWRIRKALPYIRKGQQLLDIGTHDGSLFVAAGVGGVGIDPELQVSDPGPDNVILVKGFFPHDLPEGHEAFATATALAVMEHVPEDELSAWEAALADVVVPGGRVVITVPSPTVDSILHVLMAMRLVAGIEAHQHHGFEPGDLMTIFATDRWNCLARKRFQLGLNNLFVFERRTTIR